MIIEKKKKSKCCRLLDEGRRSIHSKYPESDLVKILKDSEFHSFEWEETDQEEIDPEEIVEDDKIVIEETTKKRLPLYIFMRSGGVLHQYVYSIIFTFIK